MHIKKITLVSNNICYGPEPVPDDEIEQRLTIASSGRVWFAGYNYGGGFRAFVAGRKLQHNIGEKAASEILSLLSQYFEGFHFISISTDVGEWKLEILDSNQQKYKYDGSLCEDLFVGDIGLSERVRALIPIDGLFVFDANEYDDNEDYDE